MATKLKGGVLFIIGYLLSPLSWWNDLIINLPIAYAIALPFGFISERLFMPVMIIAYWATNILGLFLMHYSLRNIIQHEMKRKGGIIKDLLISVFYTIIVIVLSKIGILKFPFAHLR